MSLDNNFFTTNDDLRSYIHDIHNFLRNNGVGYGMNALNVFNVFYGLKLIKPKLNNLGLSDEEKRLLDFDELVRRSKLDVGITSYIDDKVLEILFEMKRILPENQNPNRELADFLFYQIPRDICGDVWKELILKIDRIPVGYDHVRKVNLSGKVYEYFVGRDKNAISELGAFFTDRHIVEFILNKLEPSLDNDNNVKTMIDPFGGSGGFTLGYAHYLRQKYPEINWNDNVNKIHHYDMQKDVVNMTGIEMFAITGVMPKRNYNYIRINSFKDNFLKGTSNYQKFMFVISNPPYGGDKYTKSPENIKKELIINKLKEQIKTLETDKENNKILIENKKKQITLLNNEIKEYNNMLDMQMVNLVTCSKRIKDFAKKYGIKNANDKEVCSLILLVDLVDKNGTAALVLKEGVFFDNKYSNLREVVTKNYNITNIISVPSNAFENTSTKTSIIVLHNNGPTTNITFSELVVETEPDNVFVEDEEGKVSLEKYKDEISNVYEKILCYATFDEISKGNVTKGRGKVSKENTKYEWSWNYKNYNKYRHFVFKEGDEIVKPENYKLIKLDDALQFKSKSKHPASHGSQTGKYRFYTSSNTIKYSNTCDINDDKNDYLIFGTGGNGSLFIDNQFSCSADNMVCLVKTKLMSMYYYCYIKYFWEEFIRFHFNGSTMGHIKKDNLINTQIPVPEDMTTIQPQLLSLRKLHEEITKNTELIPQKEKSICELIEKLTSDGKDGVDYDTYKLGDICDFRMDMIFIEMKWNRIINTNLVLIIHY